MSKINDIIKEYGTPTYVFDGDILRKRVLYLQEKLKYDLVYAVKANTFIPKIIEDLVARYEICSPGEFTICSDLGINQNQMVISGVYKDYNSIFMMMHDYPNILRYTIESFNQYELLKKLALELNRPIHILLRVTNGNQFGITEKEVFEIIKHNDSDLIIIEGLEYFTGTQKHSLTKIEKEINYLNDLIKKIKTEANFTIKEIEYGPGLPVFYYQDEEFLEDEFLNNIKNLLDTLNVSKVTIEIGRSIAASCGSYLTKVVDLKTNKNGNFAILDGGINHLVYYGQTMGMKIPYYEIYPIKDTKERLDYHLCGSLCTINDFLVKNIETRPLQLDDVFVFQKVGA